MGVRLSRNQEQESVEGGPLYRKGREEKFKEPRPLELLTFGRSGLLVNLDRGPETSLTPVRVSIPLPTFKGTPPPVSTPGLRTTILNAKTTFSSIRDPRPSLTYHRDPEQRSQVMAATPGHFSNTSKDCIPRRPPAKPNEPTTSTTFVKTRDASRRSSQHNAATPRRSSVFPAAVQACTTPAASVEPVPLEAEGLQHSLPGEPTPRC
ncbi:hypothetical protein KQX54_000170 [Cotesia glomerata]|uniref:Uncharacterized protein n=1 Tax=Cotesia glomerata TaxID=32391 RepID=A0AAV7ITW6_COTGL|nr:hypothetical protein KQX54_000170 [Cotesia glomerata]